MQHLNSYDYFVFIEKVKVYGLLNHNDMYTYRCFHPDKDIFFFFIW